MHRTLQEVMMKATITGTDPLSNRILLALDKGLRVSEIPEHYPVSLDQAKRLSRFKKMLEATKENLEEYYERLTLLGIKSLPLSHLIRNSDWGGVAEILSVVTDETTRDDLQLMIDALNEKRERIREFKEHTDLNFTQLEKADKALQTKEKELLQLQKEMNEKIKIFNEYPEPFRSFFKKSLGIYKGEILLAKRLNANWQQDLIKKGIIVYDEPISVHFVKDFYAFVASLKDRHHQGLEYHWNSEKGDDTYQLSSELSDSVIVSIPKLQQKLKEIQEKRASIEKELKEMKKKTVHSYMELAEGSESLSMIELKQHKELQNKALKWLFQRGFIAVAKLTLPNGKSADIFAYNENQIVILDIKVSPEDLMMDSKWTEFLPYCHDFYFLTPAALVPSIAEKVIEVNCGQCVETESSIKILKPDDRSINKIDQENELKFSAGQLLSRKFIYGY